MKRIDDLLHDKDSEAAHAELHELAHQFEILMSGAAQRLGGEDLIASILRKHIRSEPDKNFIERRWLVGVSEAAAEIAALATGNGAVEADSSLRTFDTTGTVLTRSCNVLTITCQDGDTANRVADQLRTTSPAALDPVTVETESSVDFHQLRGRSHDIIREALQTYDEWMLDDDYEATPKLHEIMKRMRERIDMSATPSPAALEPKQGNDK